jgi:hypothetical protein
MMCTSAQSLCMTAGSCIPCCPDARGVFFDFTVHNPQEFAMAGSDVRTKLEPAVHKSRNHELQKLFPFGVGCHHAGMLRSDRYVSKFSAYQKWITITLSDARVDIANTRCLTCVSDSEKICTHQTRVWNQICLSLALYAKVSELESSWEYTQLDVLTEQALSNLLVRFAGRSQKKPSKRED